MQEYVTCNINIDIRERQLIFPHGNNFTFLSCERDVDKKYVVKHINLFALLFCSAQRVKLFPYGEL